MGETQDLWNRRNKYLVIGTTGSVPTVSVPWTFYRESHLLVDTLSSRPGETSCGPKPPPPNGPYPSPRTGETTLHRLDPNPVEIVNHRYTGTFYPWSDDGKKKEGGGGGEVTG